MGLDEMDATALSVAELRVRFGEAKLQNGISKPKKEFIVKPPISPKPKIALLKKEKTELSRLVQTENKVTKHSTVGNVIRQLERNGPLTGSFLPGSAPIPRPPPPPPPSRPHRQSHISDDSASDGSESEIEERFSPPPRHPSTIISKDLHLSIMEEMREKGILKNTPTVQPILPADIGRMRPQSSKVNRKQQTTKSEPPHSPKLISKENKEETEERRKTQYLTPPINDSPSMESSPSCSTISDDAEIEFFEYQTGDEKEDRRLRELHGLIHELYRMQKSYVDLLRKIAVYLRNYVDSYSARTGKIIIPPTNEPNIVDKLESHLTPILLFHEDLLHEFSYKFRQWDSRVPNFAEVIVKKADFLKICNGFLKEKNRLAEELIRTMAENKTFATVVKTFEEEVMGNGIQKAGNITLVMHLDGVHQNVVRYNLLMQRYRKLLPENCKEGTHADKAIEKLCSVSEAINVSISDAESTKKLMELHRKIQGAFDVFAPSRRLIYEGRLPKQTRRDLQERHLILFSDYLLICRYMLGWDVFDSQRIYKIPIEQCRVRVESHEDYEREFAIINPKKSNAFVAKSKSERDEWVRLINETRDRWRETIEHQRRKSSRYLFPEEDSIITSIEPTTSQPDGEVEGEDALWIPDNKATKCLMEGCGSKFTVVNRRHHCRSCGWLMCRRCTGYAPIRAKKFASLKVCPHCYDEILKEFKQLSLFPHNMIEVVNEGDIISNDDSSKDPLTDILHQLDENPFTDNIRILYDDGRRRMHSSDLFKEPSNKHLRRSFPTLISTESKIDSTLLVAGKVHFRTRKGHSYLRWARLRSNHYLELFEAELDTKPVDEYFLHGYLVYIDESSEETGVEFILCHQNQIQTDRKNVKMGIRVEHTAAVSKWETALLEDLKLPKATGQIVL